nr:DEAD/DEAH box helicase [Alkalinema sp. FACHB-956]
MHGSWIPQTSQFFLWGETWRHLDSFPETQDEILPHPFLLSSQELWEGLKTVDLTTVLASSPSAPVAETPRSRRKSTSSTETSPASPWGDRWVTQSLLLPTHDRLPLLSGADLDQPSVSLTDASQAPALQAWMVSGVALDIGDALQLLHKIPLGLLNDRDSLWGEDLRFWCHTVRWGLDLLARGKFLPTLHQAGEIVLSHWQVVLDSAIDQERLGHLAHRMPLVCQSYSQATPEDLEGIRNQGRSQIIEFLNYTVDHLIRQVFASSPIAIPKLLPKGLQTWIQSLQQSQASLDATVAEGLIPALTAWTATLQLQIDQFRPCLRLHPPATGETTWIVEYGLQAIGDSTFWVSAPMIWQNPVETLTLSRRSIVRPQETLLRGLGLACRIYPVLETSLQTACPEICPLTPIQAYEFLRSIAWKLQERGIGVILPDSLANRSGWANRLGLKISATTPKKLKQQRLGLQSLLSFQWELSIGGHSLTKAEFEKLVALNMPLVEINGEWVELRPQDIQAAQNFFASRKDQKTLSLEDALRLSTGDTQTIDKLPVVSFEASGALQELVTTLADSQSITPIAQPKGFQGELRPYQARGVGWLAFLEQWGLGACLADDMGLGKTIQFIAFLLHLKQHKALESPILLVCPTSVLGNWEREIQRFGPSLKVLLHHGEKRSQGVTFTAQAKKHDLVITSYALIHRDVTTLKTVDWQGIVLDEAQNIKNAEAKQSQAIRQLEAQFRIALTGTPVENRLAELWSILDFLNPGYLGSKQFFQRRFAIPIERYGDTTSLQTLRSLVQPFILRRLKTDRSIIQDLPEKQEMTVFCGLSEQQAALYQQIVDASLADIEKAEGIQRKGIILGLLTKLKQVCNHPVLLAEKSKAPIDAKFCLTSGKIQRLEEMLEVVLAEGDRALIFTQFAEWGKLLKAYLETTTRQEVLFLYGSTPKAQREAMVDRFQQDPRAPRLFILSLKAGGVGLNLTRANHVFHFDRWWNPAVENQATDRVFRIGQKRNVQVHKFVCSGTLEERIHDMIESKRALAENVVGTGENWLTELNTDQLRDLLLLDRRAVIADEATSATSP